MSAFTSSVFVESFSAVSTLVSAYNSIVSSAKTGAIIALPVEVSVWTVTNQTNVMKVDLQITGQTITTGGLDFAGFPVPTHNWGTC